MPHTSLTRATGPFESTWDGAMRDGCVIDFETTDSALDGATVPDFFAEAGTEIYEQGWRMNPSIMADGAGSGVHGIERGSEHCVISWAQPAYLDDDGEFVFSDTFTMLVQCSSSEAPPAEPGR